METQQSVTVRCEHCGKTNRIPAASEGVPTCGNCHKPLPWIVDADDASFTEVAERASIPVMVDLWATWCGPCRQVTPALEQVARELAGRVKLVKVDIDRAPKLASRFGVQAVPTLLLMRDGEVVDRHMGAAPAGVLRSWAEKSLAQDA